MTFIWSANSGKAFRITTKSDKKPGRIAVAIVENATAANERVTQAEIEQYNRDNLARAVSLTPLPQVIPSWFTPTKEDLEERFFQKFRPSERGHMYLIQTSNDQYPTLVGIVWANGHWVTAEGPCKQIIGIGSRFYGPIPKQEEYEKKAQ